MKKLITIVLCALTMSGYTQRDEAEFAYGTYYVADYVRVTTTDGSQIARDLEGVQAHIFLHQYLIEGIGVTYWTILLTDGTLIDIEEGTFIMERDDPGLTANDSGYRLQSFTFKRLNEDDNYDGILRLVTDYDGKKLTTIEVWDFDQPELIYIQKLNNVDKYEKSDEKKFKEEYIRVTN